MNANLYDHDYASWLEQQAHFLKTGIDRTNGNISVIRY